MSVPYKITLKRGQNNMPYTPKIIMISILTKDKKIVINDTRNS